MRPVAALLLAVGIVSCSDATRPVSSVGRAHLELLPRFSAAATGSRAALNTVGLGITNVRVVITRLPDVVLKDTVVAFPDGTPEIHLELDVTAATGESLDAGLQYRSAANDILFEGHATVKVFVGVSVIAGTPVDITPIWVGPGKDATKIVVLPNGGTRGATAAIAFQATVSDASGAVLTGVPLIWSVNDATLGTIDANGVFQPSGKVGSLTVTARTPGGVSGTATIALAASAPPTAIVLVSGDAQTDSIFKPLKNPFVVKVTDVTGAPVPNATVTWTRLTGVGSLAAPTSLTDASGQASMTYTNGDLGGIETIRASVAGVTATVTFTVNVADAKGTLIVTGFAYLRVTPATPSPRVGDTLTFTADSVSGTGKTTPVAVTWASSNPGLGSLDVNGVMIVQDTGQIIVTATRNGMIGHAAVTPLAAPMLTGFSFAPKVLNGVTNATVIFSVTASVIDRGAAGVTSVVATFTAPGGATRSCTALTPTTGRPGSGTFDCVITIPAGSASGVWHATSLVLTGTTTRTFGENALATFGITTLTVNP